MANILYLEDEPWQVEGTVTTLMEVEFGHQVTVVNSLEEAEAALSAREYDAVFLDIMLSSRSGMINFNDSGLRLAQLTQMGAFEHAGNTAALPIVIASGVWDATVQEPGGGRLSLEACVLSMGIPGRSFLRKPFLAEELALALQSVLGNG